MKTCDLAKSVTLKLLLLAVSVASMEVRAERAVKAPHSEDKRLPSYSKTLDREGFESRKFSKRFKIKGWRIGDDIYIGGVKAAGDYGPGIVLDKGRYTWGFNHQGMEFQLRF